MLYRLFVELRLNICYLARLELKVRAELEQSKIDSAGLSPLAQGGECLNLQILQLAFNSCIIHSCLFFDAIDKPCRRCHITSHINMLLQYLVISRVNVLGSVAFITILNIL